MKLVDRIFKRTHSLPTEWIMATLIPSIFAKAEWIFETLHPATGMPDINSRVIKRGDNWWLCVLLADGKRYEKWYPKGKIIDAEKSAYAHDVVRVLNLYCNFGGAWSAAWIGDFRDFYLVWRDKDGDIQIQLDSAPWYQIKTWDADVWAEHAAQAHAQWAEFNKQMEWGKSELVKAAQGERQIIQ